MTRWSQRSLVSRLDPATGCIQTQRLEFSVQGVYEGAPWIHTSEREDTGSSGRRSWAVMWAWQQPWPTPRGSGAKMTLRSYLPLGWNGCAFVLTSCCIWAALGRVEPGARWLCSEAIAAGAGSWRLPPPTALQQLGQVRPVLAAAALHLQILL